MSSQGSPTLDLDVGSRRVESIIAVAATAIAIACPWMLEQLDSPLVAAGSVAAGVAVAAGFWRAGWVGTRYRLIRVVWLADGRWLLTNHRGQCHEVSLGSGSRRGPGFAWLCWHGDIRPFMLLAGSDLTPDELRRLLVRLAIDRTAGSSLQPPAAPDAALHSGSALRALIRLKRSQATRASNFSAQPSVTDIRA